MDMSVVYSCHLAGCTIECPCHICKVQSVCCKSRHESELCKLCDSQCPSHQITVPYMFDASANLFTIITEKMGEYRHAVGYAGIPSSCKHCSADVLEHQVLHLAHHQLCRYCRYESRPLDQFKGRKSLTNFRKAEQMLNWRDNLTCSVCLLAFKNRQLFTGRKFRNLSVICVQSLTQVSSLLTIMLRVMKDQQKSLPVNFVAKLSQLLDLYPVIRRLFTKLMLLLQKYLVAEGVKCSIH